MIDPSAILRASAVALAHRNTATAYPPLSAAPFHPGEAYPEYCGPVAGAPNAAYAMVRDALRDLGLDAARFGTPEWNPVGDLVAPGGNIVVKPNWVLDRHETDGGTDELVTHASVLRAVLDYVWLARPGRVVVGDAPLQLCDFAALPRLGFDRVADHFAATGRAVTVKDFRRTVMKRDATRAEVLRAHADLTATFREALEPASRVELAEELAELYAALDEARDVLTDEALHSAYLAQLGEP